MTSKVPSRDKDLDQFSEKHANSVNKKLLSEALVYLKLREVDCDIKSSISFAKKKQKHIDGTVQKDGPPGYRNLIPIKDATRQLRKGWASEKMEYKGTIGYARQIQLGVSQEKKSITQYNQVQRIIEEDRRKYQKGYGLKAWVNADEINRFNNGLKNIMKDLRSKSQHTLDSKRLSLNSDGNQNSNSRKSQRKSMGTPSYLEQINLLKEDITKQRELKPMYVTFHGQKMQQITKQFVKDVQESDPNGFIARLGVFQDAVLNNAELIQGEGLGDFQQKRQKILQFRKSLREWKPTPNICGQPANQSNIQNVSNIPMNSLRKSNQKVDLKLSKNKSSVNFGTSATKWMKNHSMAPKLSIAKSGQNLKDSKVINMKIPVIQTKTANKTSGKSDIANQKSFKSKSVSKIPANTIYGKPSKNWNKKDQQFEQDFQKIVTLIQLAKMPVKRPVDKNLEPGSPRSPMSPGSPRSPRSPLIRNNSNISGVSNYMNNGEEEEDTNILTELMKTKIWNI